MGDTNSTLAARPAAPSTTSAEPHRGRPLARFAPRTAIGAVQLLAALLAGLVALAAAAAVLSRVDVDSSTGRLRTTLVPARGAAATLRQGYTDQTAGQLGYLLTGQPSFLGRYSSGRTLAANSRAELRRLLPDDPTIRSLITSLDSAADRWRRTAAEPQLAARSRAPIPPSALLADISATSVLFDSIRRCLNGIDAHLQALQTNQLTLIHHKQTRANVVTGVLVGIALTLALSGVVLLRRRLVRPARALLDDVNTVASGAYRDPIGREGPMEFAAVADAVDRMRTNVLRHADELAETRRRLAVAEQQERVAADLHDRTLQRVFALGLTLTSAAARIPEAANALQPLVDETDDILRELRGVILGLRPEPLITDLGAAVRNLVQESSRSLGFTPALSLVGPVDVVPPATGLEMASTLREALSNIAKHARATTADVSVAVGDGELCLRVTDDGDGFEPDAQQSGYGLANIRTRARRLGGTATIASRRGAGTTLEWIVPLQQP